jgi:hypothetical protein
MLEKQLEKKCCTWAKSKFNIKNKKLTFEVGDPDRIFLYRGHCCFVEFKAPGEKARPIQKYRHDILILDGYKVLVIDDFELFKVNLTEWVKSCDQLNQLKVSLLTKDGRITDKRQEST